MRYVLMHKNTETADIEIDDVTGGILKINEIIAPTHMPVGTVDNNEKADRYLLNCWHRDRLIPTKRSGVNDVFEALDIYSPLELVLKSNGVSLSDQYWYKPYNSNLSWNDINYFDNQFSEGFGDMLFGITDECNDFNSPDITTEGNLKKRWMIIDEKRCLMKAGSPPFRQQPFNEVIASVIMERLGINHVPYSLMLSEKEPYSLCENFVTKDTELVSAYKIRQIRRKENHENGYLHYVNICKELGINIIPALDEMIVVDFIIGNEDRHFNNFGLLRNADTLEWIGAAPIFDSGTALWWNCVQKYIPVSDIKCKPFKASHSEQLRLVSDISRFDFSALDGIEEEIIEILSIRHPGNFTEESRAKIIAETVRSRINIIQQAALDQSEHISGSVNSDDLEENTAEEYDMKIE